ncbi:MAG: hypothetical protein IPL46_13515 [Saprospiraceae bacterium]|nr:hypothetical protein [Saprospiraceae bacterium]
MKPLFWTLLLATIFTAGFMRSDAHRRAIEFNIMDFEWPESETQLDSLIVEWRVDPAKRSLLSNQLRIDYIFMSVLFPAILIFCLWARKRLATVSVILKRQFRTIRLMLLIAACSQVLAWLFDFCENARLETWLMAGSVDQIILFKEMVFSKFSIGIIGFLIGAGAHLYAWLLSKAD